MKMHVITVTTGVSYEHQHADMSITKVNQSLCENRAQNFTAHQFVHFFFARNDPEKNMCSHFFPAVMDHKKNGGCKA